MHDGSSAVESHLDIIHPARRAAHQLIQAGTICSPYTPFWKTGRDRNSSRDCRRSAADINANRGQMCLPVDPACL